MGVADSAFFERNYFMDGGQADQPERYRSLVETFRLKHQLADGEPVRLARAPGRINLIGEHTDYNGCPVLPMAVNRDVVAAFVPLPGPEILASDAEEPDFQDRAFRLEESIPPYPTGDWGNYIKAAAQGIVHYLKRERGADEAAIRRMKGMRLSLSGDIPRAAGMSSSSALVVMAALALLEVNGVSVPKSDLAPLLAKAEWYVGTQGGGMDQAISLMGEPGKALKIDFNPFATEAVALPDDYVFVVANSLVSAPKTREAMDKYNRRPIECRLATSILRRGFAKKLGREAGIELIGDLTEDKLNLPKAETRRTADGLLREEPYSLADIAAVLEVDAAAVQQEYCRRKDGSLFPEPYEGFKLKQRYRHVVSEWDRVEQSLLALRAGDVLRFGRLMNESHVSCRDDYEISCPELDVLTGLAREAGALGSRLTGAGFGGCAVNLLHSRQVTAFTDTLVEQYYRGFLKLDDIEYGNVVFACKAVEGAGILETV